MKTGKGAFLGKGWGTAVLEHTGLPFLEGASTHAMGEDVNSDSESSHVQANGSPAILSSLCNISLVPGFFLAHVL